MVETLKYKLPESPEEQYEILKTIPDTWSFISGFLLATKKIYDEGNIAENTRLEISRFINSPVIIASDDLPYEFEESNRIIKEDYSKIPKIYDILFNNRLPSSVRFIEAGFRKEKVFITSIDLAREFIRRGYKGYLNIFNGYCDDEAFANRNRFCLYHQEPHIELYWDKKFKGKKEDLVSIFTKIEQLGLTKKVINL